MDSISTITALKAVQAGLGTVAPGANHTVMIFNADGTPAGKYTARQLVQDMAHIGNGYGTCSTAATTAAKTVAISDFLLLKNGIVSVLFTTSITVPNATLNVNSTGAKPIRINGNALQPGVIKAQNVVMFQYDGTNWNVIGILGQEKSASQDDLLVDMGLPSGLLWAKRNIDITQDNGFAASEFQYECSFVSWGNTVMYNPISQSAFEHDFGTWDNSKNEEENGYKADSIYGQTPGCAITASLAPSQDAARVNLGAPWRQPTTGEYAELFNNIDYIDADGVVIDSTTTDKRVTVNNIVGLYLQSKINGNRLFFPCSGLGYGTSWNSRGGSGYYWSASFNSVRYARFLYFNSGGVNPQGSYDRYYGFAVRAVQ